MVSRLSGPQRFLAQSNLLFICWKDTLTLFSDKNINATCDKYLLNHIQEYMNLYMEIMQILAIA